MPRKPRLEFSGALYHVIARGNQRRRTFLIDKDYEDYLARLWSYHKKFKFILYAYCLMPNHIHLLIETRDAPLSKIMQAIQFAYTQSFNRRHKKVGHLFQGRYKAILCQKDEYLLELIRYIHLNPVRAKIAKGPRDYRFSAHRALLGLEKHPHCDIQNTLFLFGKKRNLAIRHYESFILDAIGSKHKEELYQLKDQRILGDADFAEEALALHDAREEKLYYEVSVPDIVIVVAKYLNISPAVIYSHRRSRLGSTGRGMVAYLAKIISGKTMKEIGKNFSKGGAAMAHCCYLVEKNLDRDNQLKSKIDNLMSGLTLNQRRKFK